MPLYVDASALLKRYIEEPDSDRAEELLTSDDELVSGRHTVVEVRRNLARLLDGAALRAARTSFDHDLEAIALVEIDADTCELAATIAETTGARTLDALHLGAAQRVGGQAITVLTFDVRQAQAARSLGFPVLGT
ncbi:MAG: type II toxin-antitoxin system VapC family toxin [Acidimicrobiia bacterium]|nr:type II toxin-antitoxin system VapC family toxin [Acidimicrobiia bacterium]